MAEYNVVVHGTVTEQYAIEADSPEEAKAIFERGEATQPWLAETENAEVVRVETDRED